MNDPWPRPTQGPAKTIETDYLVIGAGAMGMAFTDTLITESGARVVMIDRACQPGGHWTTAYPFVRLHQPSAYYGVNSRALGNNTIDLVGWNQGLNELAPVGEICAYFDAVLQQQLLPTGRVDYFPMSEYLGDGRFRTLAGTEYVVTVNRRIVDATYLRAVVPSMRPAPYSVAPGVDCVAPNELPKLGTRDRYVVVGAGKTGMDVCLWLLRNDVCPDKLTWIMPRDSWLIDRATLQPGPTFVRQFRESYGATLEAIGAATSTDDLFDRLETAGTLLRIDPSVRYRRGKYELALYAELSIRSNRLFGELDGVGDDLATLVLLPNPPGLRIRHRRPRRYIGVHHVDHGQRNVPHRRIGGTPTGGGIRFERTIYPDDNSVLLAGFRHLILPSPRATL